MGSGKSEVARYLVARYGFQWIKLAETLKGMTRVLLEAYGVSTRDISKMLEGELKEATLPELGGATPRRIMQTLGTEWGKQEIHPSIWVNIAMKQAHEQRLRGRPVVIDDLRFPDEMVAIKEAGGLVINVVRPGAAVTSDHSSEGALAGYRKDWTLHNSGPLQDLRRSVDRLMTVLAAPPPANP